MCVPDSVLYVGFVFVHVCSAYFIVWCGVV
jgi:hypothetical protein